MKTVEEYKRAASVIIRQLRTEQGLSVEEAATRAGVAAPTWYSWENGHRGGLTREAIVAVTSVLDITSVAFEALLQGEIGLAELANRWSRLSVSKRKRILALLAKQGG